MDDLKYIKKHYGEKFMHLCRELFPSILEEEGLLTKLITDRYPPSRYLYNDVLPYKDDFRIYINSFIETPKIDDEEVTKTPEQLFDEAGYILYPECKNEEDIQKFYKYYAESEKLCTFNCGRLEDARVWFAVKKNVDKIKREDFTNPERQDEYGTSVLSIQFQKGEFSTLSIKNRYNHRVCNPDSTFGNNLDNIIHGLTQSFIQTYNINLIDSDKKTFEIPGYRQGDDGRFYKVNFEFGNVNYCGGNIVLKNGHVIKFDKDRYIVAENYIFDRCKPKVRQYFPYSKIYRKNQKKLGAKYKLYDYTEDAFTESIGKIKNLSTTKDEHGNQVIIIKPIKGKPVEITLNECNGIIGYKNPNLVCMNFYFMRDNKNLLFLEAENLERIDNGCLTHNENLSFLNAPKLKQVGDYFLNRNIGIKSLYLPELEHTGCEFLYSNKVLEKIILPNLKSAKAFSLENVVHLKKLYAPNWYPNRHISKETIIDEKIVCSHFDPTS